MPAPHDWASPRYGMTARQRLKWRQLWQLASQRAGSRDPDPQGSQGSQSSQAMDLEAWAMTAIEKACLEFCIELLNQRHHSHKYESALVCTMAVLGQGKAGWWGPESYPLILSRVIKVARFMVVQKAVWMDPNPWQIIQTWVRKDQSAEWVLTSADNQLREIDEGYGSDDPPSTPGPPSSPPSSIHSDDPLPAVNIRHSRRPFQGASADYSGPAPHTGSAGSGIPGRPAAPAQGRSLGVRAHITPGRDPKPVAGPSGPGQRPRELGSRQRMLPVPGGQMGLDMGNEHRIPT
ncbi:hypothetical protein IFM51744_10960 [Aspergillus udagawae]|nr:hypothetical protein IFM51744_10960 [Aspergillus udagawae]